MRTNNFFYCLIINLFFISTTAFAQGGNFDQTWKEFLENNKISNMSTLIKPNKAYEQPKYAKYLLMNTNSSFCQSDVEDAENLIAELQEIDSRAYTAIPGFIGKLEELNSRIKAYHSIDGIWKRFLLDREVPLRDLEAITAAKTSCEKKTLAKYSYMTAYYHFCQGDIATSKDIFENRTLRLTEKTTLRVQDVEGLAGEVAKMKSLYQDMDKLDVAWRSFVATGVSPGFDTELPLFACNPIPKMKELILNGVLDVCNSAPAALQRIKELQAESGVVLDRELSRKLQEMEAAIEQKNLDVVALNEAWEDFIIDNKVRHMGRYGYEYCSTEPLIRAYIMDGFAYVCELGEEMLQKIDDLQRRERIALEQITMIKINELAALTEEYQANGVEIEMVWRRFIAQGNTLRENYQSADFYCDNIHQVEDWTIRGLSGTCEEGHQYLEQIDDFQRTFEFNFFEELDCRVQDLRIKVWECRREALLKLARIEAPEATEARLGELMQEYGVGERPEKCF